jgi:hypothetical protein
MTRKLKGLGMKRKLEGLQMTIRYRECRRRDRKGERLPFG